MGGDGQALGHIRNRHADAQPGRTCFLQGHRCLDGFADIGHAVGRALFQRRQLLAHLFAQGRQIRRGFAGAGLTSEAAMFLPFKQASGQHQHRFPLLAAQVPGRDAESFGCRFLGQSLEVAAGEQLRRYAWRGRRAAVGVGLSESRAWRIASRGALRIAGISAIR